MTRIQQPVTKKPLAAPLAMSTAQDYSVAPSSEGNGPTLATPSPIPVRGGPDKDGAAENTVTSRDLTRPLPQLPQPRLMFEARDLDHEGAAVFFEHVNPIEVLKEAISSVLNILYRPSKGNLDVPAVRSVTLVLRTMGGVAYTTGKEFDSAHKEIHFSLNYIGNIDKAPYSRRRDEIYGVLVHEMTHVWQHSAPDTPSGLIEGIADFVRMKAGYSPPHWKREAGEEWDAGYDRTAYFLNWIENKYGEGTVEKINLQLKRGRYEEDDFWKKAVGHKIEHLWDRYCKELDGDAGEVVDRSFS